MTAPTQIDVTVESGVTVVTLNGPPKNEMGIEFFAELARFTESLRTESRTKKPVHGMIIRGAGRHFSSGANVPEIEALGASEDGRVAALLKDNIRSFRTLSTLPYPVVALVRGCCLGAGMELALACSYRIAEPNAVFALPEVTWGIMPGCGGSVRLPKLIGKAAAASLILTGRSVLADEAPALGIADKVVPRNSGMAAALDLIREKTAHEKS